MYPIIPAKKASAATSFQEFESISTVAGLSFEKVEEAIRLSLNKILRRERNTADIKKLKAEWKGHWRVRIGSIRVIFRYEDGEPIVTYITRIEFRGSVY